MKYLIAIDSDGTLRHSDGTISERAKKIIKRIKNSGSVVVLCTARPRYHALKLSRELEIDEYLISSNGTEVYDGVNDTVIWASYIDKDDCLKIYEQAIAEDLRVIFVADNTEYVTKYRRNDDQILLTANNKKELLNNEIKQIMIIGKELEKITNFKNSIMNSYHLDVIDSSNKKEEIWFSVVSSNSSKGNALLKLAQYLNIPIDNTIAIGNDRNDISMLQTANIGLAVENATEETKKAAADVIASNDNDGVAIFLESFCNKEISLQKINKGNCN